MDKTDGRDIVRQAAVIVAALFQVGATFFAATRIQEAVDEGPTPLAEPAGYAFAIWALIFTLSLAYAVYQALPAQRESLLLRRVGLPTAGAFACTGLWSVFVPLQQFLLAQAMLLGIFAFLLVAYLRLARRARGHDLGRGERWLVALPLGPFLGWVTAANAVSLSSEAVRFGLVDAGSTSEALLGAALLLLGGLLAAAVILFGRAGPAQGYAAYAAAVLWALVGVVVNQYDASALTTGAAVVAAVPVTLALFEVLRKRSRPSRAYSGTGPAARPGTAQGPMQEG